MAGLSFKHTYYQAPGSAYPNDQIKAEFEKLINDKYADKIEKINQLGGWFVVNGFADDGKTLKGYLDGPPEFVAALVTGRI